MKRLTTLFLVLGLIFTMPISSYAEYGTLSVNDLYEHGQEECARLLRFLYENSVQPELWRDAISNWYPQTAAAEVLREGGRVV